MISHWQVASILLFFCIFFTPVLISSSTIWDFLTYVMNWTELSTGMEASEFSPARTTSSLIRTKRLRIWLFPNQLVAFGSTKANSVWFQSIASFLSASAANIVLCTVSIWLWRSDMTRIIKVACKFSLWLRQPTNGSDLSNSILPFVLQLSLL